MFYIQRVLKFLNNPWVAGGRLLGHETAARALLSYVTFYIFEFVIPIMIEGVTVM